MYKRYWYMLNLPKEKASGCGSNQPIFSLRFFIHLYLIRHEQWHLPVANRVQHLRDRNFFIRTVINHLHNPSQQPDNTKTIPNFLPYILKQFLNHPNPDPQHFPPKLPEHSSDENQGHLHYTFCQSILYQCSSGCCFLGTEILQCYIK